MINAENSPSDTSNFLDSTRYFKAILKANYYLEYITQLLFFDNLDGKISVADIMEKNCKILHDFKL